MTEPLLSSLLNVMPAIQAKQISELLESLKAAGQIRDTQEYTNKLKDLSTLINSNIPVPSFNKIRALSWYLCSSDAHNIMMQSAKQDIEAAFLQIKELEEKYSDHYVLLVDNILKDLENGLNKQEAKIKKLEWLSNKNNEFTNVLVDTFNSTSSLQFSRNQTSSETLYYDNRTYLNKTEEELPSAVVSKHGEKLILDTEQEALIKPISVSLESNNYSYASERDVNYEDDITNIIDGKKNTYWSNNVCLSDKVDRVDTVLKFNLGSGKEITYIVVESGGSAPFYITSIKGISPFGFQTELLTEDITVDGKTRIDFNKINVSSVLVTFSTYTFKKSEYFTNNQNLSLDSVQSKKMNLYSSLERNDKLANVSRKAIISNEVADICNIPKPKNRQIDKHIYSVCIDNVWFGNGVYIDSGIYVSIPLKVENPGVVGVSLKKKEETGTIKNSIECEIIKIDKYPKYKESKFPIPELNQTTISDERLVLTKKVDSNIVNDTGIIRFFPFISSSYQSGDSLPITVYKNGTALSLTSGDWTYTVYNSFSDPSYSLNWRTSFLNFSLSEFSSYVTPLKFYIKIKNPVLNAIYTVDYTIQTSEYVNIDDTSQTIWLDKERQLYIGQGGRVHILKNEDVDISSELYLQLTLRRNNSLQSVTPELYEYALLAASYTK